MSEYREIQYVVDGPVATITMNRPDQLNALTDLTQAEVRHALDLSEINPTVIGSVLTGAGRGFCAGADLASGGSTFDARDAEGRQTAVARDEGGLVSLRIFDSKKPVIAAIAGYALGGGCELALACHLRVASEKARFGLPEVGLGIIPGYGGTVRLARLVGLGRAIELTLTGDMIEAERAQAIGLVSLVAKPDAVIDEAKALARRITKNGPIAVRLALESMYRALDTGTEDALGFESAAFGLLASTEDMKEGMEAFLNKRKVEFKGV